MKYLITCMLAGAMVLAMSTVSKAQSDDATLTAGATVLANVEVQKVEDLEFNQIVQGINKTVSFDATGTIDVNANGGPQGGETLGRFNVFGPENLTVTIGFNEEVTALDGQGDAEGIELVFSLISSFFNLDGSEDLITGTGTDVPASGTVDVENFPADGIAVLVGGTVTPTNDQVLGRYEAEIQLNASFN